MSQDPEILDRETGENQLKVKLHVPRSIDVFEGHFPSEPVLPGFLQVGWVEAIGSEEFDGIGTVDSILSLKFRNKLGPGDRCWLNLDYDPDNGILSFSLQGLDQSRISSGRIKFSVES
jgi:3-hydroxymyristoyl/3-hydroxydecanoyl-(acyl carrier protein) dehydratase